MHSFSIYTDPDYRGQGISEGLSRGLLVSADGTSLTGEGMGIGAPSFRTGERTYFSRRIRRRQIDSQHWIHTDTLDTCLEWRIHGRCMDPLTRCLERAADLYMRLTPFQRHMLPCILPTRNLFSIHPSLQPVSPVGEVCFEYRVSGGTIVVNCGVDAFTEPPPAVYLMNELSANYFTAAWGAGPLQAPPPWERIPCVFPTDALYDPAHRLLFRITAAQPGPGTMFRIFRGREKTDERSWAGFILELTGDGKSPTDAPAIRYEIEIAEASRG
ncbi:MAG: hypothetical protein QMC96_01890 [Methanomicrobiales archaeon]|nr:hypothetical protein [Methanomicrobiales archaeon]